MSDEARARELAFELPLSVGPHPPKWVTDKLAAALSAAELRGRMEGLREASNIVQDVPLDPMFDLENGQVVRVCGFAARSIDSRLAALSREETTK